MESEDHTGPATNGDRPESEAIARARRATATARSWIEQEFGLLSSTDVEARLGLTSPTGAHELRLSGKLLAATVNGEWVFPGFQFARSGGVRPVIPQLVAAARNIDWAPAELILWLCSPSRYFEDERPVDHLDDKDFLSWAVAAATVEW